MTPRLERILNIAAWANLAITLLALTLMGLARDAQAADVETAQPPIVALERL